MRHIAMFSGGVGSWAAARRMVERHGRGQAQLLFCDTLIEDKDLYRFLVEGACNIFGEPIPTQLLQWWETVPEWEEDEAAFRMALETLRADMAEVLPQLIWISDGRDPWQVFFDERFLGGTRGDPCSKILKRLLADGWLAKNCDPTDTVVYVGIDWTEIHRFEGDPERPGDTAEQLSLLDTEATVDAPSSKKRLGLKRRRAAMGWTYEAPMCEAPFLWKPDMLRLLKAEGIRPPRLYDLGFAHNNCGGFCVKAGIGSFANLYRTLPLRYARHEALEEKIRAVVGWRQTILRDRTGGATKPLSLAALRERIEAGGQIDRLEIGGCGCFIDDPEADAASANNSQDHVGAAA